MHSITHLLMPRVLRTDDVYSAFPPYHGTPIAYPLHRRPNFHPSRECLRCLHHGWCRGMDVGVHMGHRGKPHTGEQGPARGEEGAQHGGECVSWRARQASRPGRGSRSRADFCAGRSRGAIRHTRASDGCSERRQDGWLQHTTTTRLRFLVPP